MPDIEWGHVWERVRSAFAEVDWGDAPTWMATVLAALAALAAWRAFRGQRRQLAEQRTFIADQIEVLEFQRAELHAAAQDRRRAQARLVELSSGLAEDADTLPEGVEPPVFVASVTNSSREAIREVDVRFGPDSEPAEVVEPFGTRRGSKPPYALLGPRRGVNFVSATLPEDDGRPVVAVVRFTDHQGVHWRLDEDGGLTELDDRDAW